MSSVKLERQGSILQITLDRPKANAINRETSLALFSALEEFEHDPVYRVAILTGAGDKFFSTGWDLKSAASGEAIDVNHGPGGFAGLTEFFSLTKPVIAAVNGLAVGGGFELALACDMIIATEHAEFFLPEAKLGIVPDAGGVFRLPKRLPRALAMEMMLTGKRLLANEAEKRGLVNRVVHADELIDSAWQMASSICHGAPLAQRAIKELVHSTETLNLKESFALQRSGVLNYYEKMLKSMDAREGAIAFTEGRKPVWQGY